MQISAQLRTLFRYIEDADLWRWQLPESRQFHAGLGEMKLEYDANINPAIFDQLCMLPAEQLIDKAGESAVIRHAHMHSESCQETWAEAVCKDCAVEDDCLHVACVVYESVFISVCCARNCDCVYGSCRQLCLFP